MRSHSIGFRRAVGFALLVALAAGPAAAQQVYQKPPKEILDVLDAPPTPQISVSPSRDSALLATPVAHPSIAELAQPMLRLAGLRINPANNGPHYTQRYTGIVLKRIADGSEKKLALPQTAHLSFPAWAPDGKHFLLTNDGSRTVELWIGATETATVRMIPGVPLNSVFGLPCDWMPNGRTVVCLTVPGGRPKPPEKRLVPTGPRVQESFGKPSPTRTYEDLLQDANDEKLFDYYATSQLALVDTVSAKLTPIGRPAILRSMSPSPDGQHILVTRIHRPYSYLVPAAEFPQEIQVWNREGRLEYKLADLPLADNVPIGGVPTGPRNIHWHPTEPATLVWVEALDNGNPKKKVSYRDRVLWAKAPFHSGGAGPVELTRTEQRFAGLSWGERGDFAILRDFDRATLRGRAWFLNPASPSTARLVWNLSTQDRYRSPGTPIQRLLPSGHYAILEDGDSIYLTGPGGSAEGDRPFLDRMDIKNLKTQRIFRCDDKSYETVLALLAPNGSKYLTRRESPADPPNYFIRAANGEASAFTKFQDPAPQLRGIKKELVKYKRPDGVGLSFTLYLPPDFKPGDRRPGVLWAYPLEFADIDVAGQVTGSANQFTMIRGSSHLFFLLEGYVILDGASMPVVGDPETVNNTYVEQIVASAKAAIDKAVDMGVLDPNRVGVGGHSYGAFMTANLLAHSDLFRAGIARSGAYNRTLTPFGFQNERRSLWEAPDLYMKVSPFLYANKIHAPILLIHGEADNNTGTFPIQSERMYHAIKGNGGSVRYVTLPHESHGYAGRESVEHVLWEMLNWFDKYVKNPAPHPVEASSASSGAPRPVGRSSLADRPVKPGALDARDRCAGKKI